VEGVYNFLWEAESLPEEGEIPEAFSVELSSLEDKFHARLFEDFDTAGAISRTSTPPGRSAPCRRSWGQHTDSGRRAVILPG